MLPSPRLPLVAAALAIASPLALIPAAPAEAATARTMTGNGLGVADFYQARRDQPLWFAAGRPGPQVGTLLSLLQTSAADGLDPARYPVGKLRNLVARATAGGRSDIRKADMALSEAFVAYVRDLRRPGDVGIEYVDAELRPTPPTPRIILDSAAKAPSLDRYLRDMAWMHPIYAQLREGLLAGKAGDKADQLRVNLERARELPAASRKHVLVNAAAQRLFIYENGKVVDSMRVVVGKPVHQTPMMAALIRFANLNPYWFVPPDLARERIAPIAAKQGVSYLERQGYEVVSDFVPDPKIIDPATIDWQAVADGKTDVLIRQQPGPQNSMGRIKFMFPNPEGIYLHDNPERQLFEEASRLYSGGCVRLEAAWRLSKWLFGRELTWKGAVPEEPVPLATPVPVYITYLTATPDGSSIAFFDDVYGRDASRMAMLKQRSLTGRSASLMQGR